MTDPHGPAEQRPADYRLLLPDGWFRIGLSPEVRDRSVDALVERQFAGMDDAPLAKRDARDQLRRRAKEAWQNGGIELYLSLQLAGVVPLSASLLVTVGPAGQFGARSLDELAEQLADDPEVRVTKGELPAGPAIRARYQRTAGESEGLGSHQVVTAAVDYYVPVPSSDFVMLLSFSTPLEALADALAELFDAIAHGLAWTGDGGAAPADDAVSVPAPAPAPEPETEPAGGDHEAAASPAGQ